MLFGSQNGGTNLKSLEVPTMDHDHRQLDETALEKLARSRWGEYLSDIERKALLIGHSLAAAPTVLLDVGADGGRWSRLLCDLGWQAICTEVNEHSLRLCK